MEREPFKMTPENRAMLKKLMQRGRDMVNADGKRGSTDEEIDAALDKWVREHESGEISQSGQGTT